MKPSSRRAVTKRPVEPRIILAPSVPLSLSRAQRHEVSFAARNDISRHFVVYALANAGHDTRRIQMG
jgi:hypothetical protein